MRKIYLILGLLVIGFSAVYAQEPSQKELKWSGGVVIGTSNFLRTFNMTRKTGINHYAEDMNFSFGLNATRKWTEVISLEGEWLYGKLSGTSNDPKYPVTKIYETNFHQLTASGLFNLNNLFSKEKIERSWYLYGKAGVGVANFDGHLDQKTQNHFSFIVPLGLGVNFRVNEKINLGIVSCINIGNDWANSEQEWASSNNTYWEIYQNTGIKLTYRFSGKKPSKKVAEEVVPVAPKPAVTEKPVVIPEPAVKEEPKELPVKEKEEMIEPKVEKKAQVKEADMPILILEEVPEERTIVAREGWRIKNGFVWGELPIEGVVYRVQVLATYKQMISEENAEKDLNVDGPFIEYKVGNVYKYAVAKDFDSYRAAKAYSIELNKAGKYKDTFVVAFKNGIQIK